MYRISLAVFDSEKATRKKIKFLLEETEAVVVCPVGLTVDKLASQTGCLVSDLTQLTQSEVDHYHQLLIAAHRRAEEALKTSSRRNQRVNLSLRYLRKWLKKPHRSIN